MATVIAAVAQVLGVAADFMGIQKSLELTEEIAIERCRAADGKRETVTDQREALCQGAELAAETAADAYPVFRSQLQKIKITGLCFQQLWHEAPA